MNGLGLDIAALTKGVFAFPSTAVTAGGSGDATLITGVSLDISALAQRPRSVNFVIPFKFTLAAAETVDLACSIETSPDDTNWTVETSTEINATLTGAAGGSTNTGCAEIGCNLTRAGVKYVRVKCTPDCSAKGTDAGVVGAAVAVFGGQNVLPTT